MAFAPFNNGMTSRRRRTISGPSSSTNPQIRDSKPLFASSSSSSPAARDNNRKVVQWTVANLFSVNDTLLVVYHVAGAAWDNLVPFGALAGALAYQLGIFQPYPSALQSAGEAAWFTGLLVMILGVLKLFLVDVSKPSFVDMATEAESLKTDFSKRVMDQSAWIGCGLALIPMMMLGGPSTVLGLAPGANGVIQGLCLGTVAGSALGFCRQRM